MSGSASDNGREFPIWEYCSYFSFLATLIFVDSWPAVGLHLEMRQGLLSPDPPSRPAQRKSCSLTSFPLVPVMSIIRMESMTSMTTFLSYK
jgi:hypothetical protein